MAPVILRLRGVRRAFGGILALNGVDLDIPRGGIVGLIGPNGSGKTTLFNVVSGMDPDGEGEVRFNGMAILGRRPSWNYGRGLARTFQLSRVFPGLTVLENLLVASRQPIRLARAKAMGLLDEVGLPAYAQVRGDHLSYGQQRLVEFLRAIMNDPSLVLLDEPAAGVNPTLRQILWGMVRTRNQQGVTFLIIEHDMTVIASLCQEVYVLNEGVVLDHGDFAKVRTNPLVMEAYFGRQGGSDG